MKKDRAGVVKLLAKVQHKLSEERCEEMKSNQFKYFCAFAQARLDMLDQAEPASSQPKQKRRASSQPPASPDAAPARRVFSCSKLSFEMQHSHLVFTFSLQHTQSMHGQQKTNAHVMKRHWLFSKHLHASLHVTWPSLFRSQQGGQP